MTTVQTISIDFITTLNGVGITILTSSLNSGGGLSSLSVLGEEGAEYTNITPFLMRDWVHLFHAYSHG